MERLTKKYEDNSGYRPIINHPVRKEITLFDFEEQDYDCCIDKLGKLEDLMENYGIESVEELEQKILANPFYAFVGARGGGKKIMQKGIHCLKFEEETGINLEDLFKELIDIKNDLGEVDSDINPDYMAYEVSNGITYGKLSKELGCDLDVVFKALKDGIFFKNKDFSDLDFALRSRLYYSDDFKCFRFECGYGSHYEYLSNYQKTWWLASDKKEKIKNNCNQKQEM